MHATRNPNGAVIRAKEIADLNYIVAISADLTMAAKTAHWNVRGEEFMMLHKLFDEVYEKAAGWTDDFAERCAQVGGQVKGTLQDACESTKMPKFDCTKSASSEVLPMLIKSLAFYAAEISAGFKHFTSIGDDTTADLFLQTSHETEKLLWFLESHVNA